MLLLAQHGDLVSNRVASASRRFFLHGFVAPLASTGCAAPPPLSACARAPASPSAHRFSFLFLPALFDCSALTRRTHPLQYNGIGSLRTAHSLAALHLLQAYVRVDILEPHIRQRHAERDAEILMKSVVHDKTRLLVSETH